MNDQSVADALLGAAREWLRQRGARVIRGPVNPSTNYECGLLVDGFDSSPQVMMPYNPPYYAELLERAGLRKAKDLYAYQLTTGRASRWRRSERVAHRAAEAEPGAHPPHPHEGVPAGSGTGLGSLQRGLEPQLGLRADDAG